MDGRTAAAEVTQSPTAVLLQVVRVCWPLLLGNVLEWYEFSAYGYLEQQIQGNFFHGSAIATWLGFAVTFVARPMGGLVLGWVGDRFGRRTSVNISIWGMLFATVGQGLLPTYRSGSNVLGGIGLALLVVLRFLQGLCTGGEVSAIATYMVEVAPRDMLGRAVSLLVLGVSLGFLCAISVVLLVTACFGDEQLMQWGWRVPFLLALAPGLVAVWGRRRVPESEAFLHEAQRRQEASGGQEGGSGSAAAAASMAELFGKHGGAILIGAGGAVSTAILTYVSSVWSTSYLKSRGLGASNALLIGILGNAVQLLVTVPVGWLTDVKGAAWVRLVGGLSLALLGLPIFALISAFPTSMLAAVVGVGFGFSLVGALNGATVYLFIVELFPTSVRNVGIGISLNMSFVLFGGFGPFISEASLHLSRVGPGVFMSLSGLITVAAVLWGLRLERRGLVRLTHIRAHPYFGSARAAGAWPTARAVAEPMAHDLGPLPVVSG